MREERQGGYRVDRVLGRVAGGDEDKERGGEKTGKLERATRVEGEMKG